MKDIALSFNPEPRIKWTPRSVWPLEDFTGLSSQTTLDEFRKFLDGLGLSKDAETRAEDDIQYLIISPPGAYITFHGGRLLSIHVIDRTPPKKQISLSVAEDTFNQLKNLARQSKKSVSAICAEWITQRANDLQRAPEEVGSRGSGGVASAPDPSGVALG